MSRVIYSLYIDVPKEKLDIFDKHILKENETPANLKMKQAFIDHYDKLIESKKRYADKIGAEFQMYEYDEDYIKFHEEYSKKYPFLTDYNIINKYKLHILDRLVNYFDEVLYLDFDAIPLTNENFFDVWNLEKGIAILHNNDKIRPTAGSVYKIQGTIRSPSAKYFNAMAMLEYKGYSPQCDVVNTAIVGANKKHWSKLKYFHNLKEDFGLMTYLKDNSEMYPPNVVKTFGYDNETIFSYKIVANKVPIQWLDSKWHFFYDDNRGIPEDTKICHAINKEFERVWKHYDKKFSLHNLGRN